MNYIRNFQDVGMDDVGLVGGKNASLGEMIQAFKKDDIPIPEGFVITSEAFTELMNEGKLTSFYDELDALDTSDVTALRILGEKIRAAVIAAGIPETVKTSIEKSYEELCRKHDQREVAVSVRSSATAEDLPGASFAGQQETFLNVRGKNELLNSCLKCFASLFTDRAISYRVENGFDHRKVKLSIGIQEMVRSDLASSGVIFTLDTESGARNVILISSSYGLGENIVAGKVNPDEFLVSKPLLGKVAMPILSRKLGDKQMELVYDEEGKGRTKNIETPPEKRARFSLGDSDVITLARWAKKIEAYYTQKNHAETPMDIEWARDGETGKLYILQARPETVHAEKKHMTEVMSLKKRSHILLRGRAVGQKIGSGKVRIIRDTSDLNAFEEGEVLVAQMTDPDWEPVMRKASAIITDRGGRTCHAAIVGREQGVPCVVGTGTGTQDLESGREVTVSCAEGDEALVYEGVLPYETKEILWDEIGSTRTKIMVNLANPDEALKVAQYPVDGVGLVRLEFIIADLVKVHPMALLHPEKVTEEEQKKIHSLARGFEQNLPEYFVKKLAEGISTIAGAFYPRPVIVRFSDFKTNEYAHLIGGKAFEPVEENPMIGFRGASRYYHELYSEGFGLECRAIRYVRNDMGLTNVKVMVPFCRTAREGELVIQEMASHHLKKGDNGLEVYVMCELPSNVLDLEAFAGVFDGFSIGSNDLTQMTLGVDRDSALVSSLFDERDPAAMKMLDLAVTGARNYRKPVGICGQAPSDYPEICRFLVEKGIDSISLLPDSVFQARKIIADAEKDLKPASVKRSLPGKYAGGVSRNDRHLLGRIPKRNGKDDINRVGNV